MSRLINKLTASLLAVVMAAGTVTTAAAQTVPVTSAQPKTGTVTVSSKTEKVELKSEVVFDTPDSAEEKSAPIISAQPTEDSGTIGDLSWSYDADTKTVTISGEGELVEQHPTGLWYGWEIDKVIIKDGVTSIGENGLDDCNAKEIILPNTLTSIGYAAFQLCKNLESIIIPESVTTIGEAAFYNCKSLSSVTLPSTITAIEKSTFNTCKSLESITLPDSVTSIGESAFYNCSALDGVIIPENVKSIGKDAFRGTGLTDIKLPDGIEQLGDGVFADCDGLESFVIPPKVNVLPQALFEGCGNLKSVTMHEGITEIGSYAFSGCALTSVELPQTLEKINLWAFQYCPLTEVDIPDSVTQITNGAFANCHELTRVKFPNAIEKLMGFDGCYSLTTIDIPASVTEIGYQAFMGCRGLTEVVIPDSVVTIGEYAFSDCTSLEKLTLSKNLKSIGNYALQSCPFGEGLTFPDTLEEIGDYAVRGTKLQSVALPDSVKTVGWYAFGGNSSLTQFTLSKSMTEISVGMFDQTALTDITIPDNITVIGEAAFSYCRELKSVTIPNSVTTVGSSAFYFCSLLDNVVLPDSVTTMKYAAFDGCKSLKKITLSNSLTKLDDNVFMDCESLETIRIPQSVTSIGSGAFHSCTSLKTVYIPDSVTEIAVEDNNSFIQSPFLECSDFLTIQCSVGSYAQEYAEAYNINYEFALDDADGTIIINTDKSYLGQILMISYANSSARPIYRRAIDKERVSLYGLSPSVAYKAQIVSDKGSVFAVNEDITFDNGIAEISFSDAKPVCTAAVTVKGGETEITDSCKIMWYTEDGDYVGTGSTLKNVTVGDVFKFTVSFKYKALGEKYFTPDEQTVTIDGGSTKKIVKLEAVQPVILTGKAIDENGKAVTGANVSLTQTFGDDNEKTLTTVTDESGAFKFDAKNVPSKLIVRKAGNERFTKEYESLTSEPLDILMKTVELYPVDLNVTMRELDSEESNAMTGAYELTIYNSNTGNRVEDFFISNGQLMLPSNEVGQTDIINVTASCDGCADQYATVDLSRDGELSVEFVPNGELLIVQKAAPDKANTALIFGDWNGRFITSIELKKQKGSSEGLIAGDYAVVMMNKADRYAAPRTLAEFDKFGLEENKDYIKTLFRIEDGKTTKLENVSIPDMDENKATVFDRSKTFISVNRTSVSAGQFAVVTVDYAIKDEIDASDINLALSFPSDSLRPQYNSVTVDGKAVYLEYGGGDELTIPVDEKSGTVVIALKTAETGSNCVITAEMTYKNGSDEVSETVGSVSVDVEGFFTFFLPDLVANTTVCSFGTTLPKKKIEYYDNGVLAGTAYSNSLGDYTMEFELVDPGKRSYHEIYAVLETGDGLFQTSPRDLEYNSNAIVAEKLDVYYSDHLSHVVTINFISAQENTLTYAFNPSLPEFTYEVFFQGDASKVTYAAVVTTGHNGSVVRIPLKYDKDRGTFVGSYTYTTENRPADISLDFSAEQENYVDYTAMYSETDKFIGLIEDYNAAAEELGAAAEELEAASVITKDEMISCLKEYGFTDETIAVLDLDELLETTNKELQDYITMVGEAADEACAEEIAHLDACFEELNALYENRDEVYGVYEIDESVTAEQLIKEGYKQINTTDGNGLIFERGSDKNEYDFIDLTRRYAVVYPEETDFDKLPSASGAALDIESSAVCADCDHNIIPRATIADLVKDLSKAVKPAAKNIRTLMKWIDTFQKSQLGFLNSVSDTFDMVVPDGLGDPSKLNNPQLKFLAEKVVGKMASQKWLQGMFKFNAKIQAILAPLQALCEGILALSDLGDICSMIERLAPKLCKCTQFSNNRVKWAINDLVFQIGAIAADITMCSIPNFNSFYDLCKSGWKNAWKGLAKLKLIKEKDAKSLCDPFAHGRQSARDSLLMASRFLSDCKCDNEKDDKNQSKRCIKLRSSVDPSGYICEAVASNRIEGVTATLWYSENSDGENAVIWDAEDWSQTNPLISDNYGHYEWYVPEGWWQVSFEKDGYQKAYSDWVPVLPIQTELNVSMKTLYAPQVEYVTAYSDGIDIAFSQYMDIDTVNGSNVKITVDNKEIAGTIEPTNAEQSFDDSSVMYASKFRFTPESELGGTANVTIDKVKNYSGIYIDSAYNAEVKTVEKLTGISVPEQIEMTYNSSSDIEITLIPENAAAGVEVTVRSGNENTLTVGKNTVTTDENGKAAVNVTGKLPSTTEVIFTVAGTDITASTKVVLVTDDKTNTNGKLGDVDGDGEITANDALLILRSSVGLTQLNPDEAALADIDDDGEITANDALAVLRYSAGLAEDDSPINKAKAA